jgi:hypothetical protein
MPVFSQIENRQPPDVVRVPPNAFSSTWSERPGEDVAIGLRFVPDADLEDARVEAYRRAERLFPEHDKSDSANDMFVASFQDALMRWVIARGTCDPNDVTKPWYAWSETTDDIVVEVALTDHGAQLIFDAWERMRIAGNIGLAVASDADLALLPEMLARLPAMGAVSRTRELRVRRLLRFVLEELEAVEVPETAPDSRAPENPNAAGESTTLPPLGG